MKKRRNPLGEKKAVESLASVLPAVGRLLNLDVKAQEIAFGMMWHEVVPAEFAKNTWVAGIVTQGDRKTLRVRVSDQVAASALQFELAKALEGLNARGAGSGIRLTHIQLV